MSSSWTLKPHSRGGCAFFNAFSLSACGLLCTLLLSSCGQPTPGGYSGSPESTLSSGTLQPIAAPPNASDSPPAPGTTGAPKTANGLPALHVKGNNTALFSQKMSSEVDRLDRLENAVQELRNDFDSMAPAIVRLVAIEGDIQNLIKQLEVLTGPSPSALPADITPIEEAALEDPIPLADNTNPPPLPPVAPLPTQENALEQQTDKTAAPSASLAPSETPSAQKDQTQAASGIPAPDKPPPPPVASGPPPVALAANGVSVREIRVGTHPDKTRIVLDVSGKTSFTTDLDNNEKILVVELPETGWSAEAQKTFAGDPLLASYRTEKLGENGTMLIIQLKKQASLGYKNVMNNDDGNGQRVVIDLMTK